MSEPRTIVDVDADMDRVNIKHPAHDPVSHKEDSWATGCRRCAAMEPLWEERQRLLLHNIRSHAEAAMAASPKFYRVSLNDESIRKTAARFYNARPDHMKFQHCPTFDRVVPYIQNELMDLVRRVLVAATQEES